LLFLTKNENRNVASQAEIALNTIQVLQVIEIERQLHFNSRVQVLKTTACIIPTREQGYMLYISAAPDFFDIAIAISPLIFTKVQKTNPLLLSTLLTTSLQSLRDKGFNVDRILNQPKDIPRQLVPSQQLQLQQRQQPGKSSVPLPSKQTQQKPDIMTAEENLSILREAFPQVPYSSIEALYNQSRGQPGDPVQRTAEKIMEQHSKLLETPPKQTPKLTTGPSSPSLPLHPSSPTYPTPQPNQSQGQGQGIQTQTTREDPGEGRNDGMEMSGDYLKRKLEESVRSVTPPSSNTIKADSVVTQMKPTTCDVKPSADLVSAGSFAGISLFLDRRSDPTIFVRLPTPLEMFARILTTVARVFNLDSRVSTLVSSPFSFIRFSIPSSPFSSFLFLFSLFFLFLQDTFHLL
jgi:hypothetical protein